MSFDLWLFLFLCVCVSAHPQGAVITPAMDHTISMQPANMMGPLTQQMNHLSLGTTGTVSNPLNPVNSLINCSDWRLTRVAFLTLFPVHDSGSCCSSYAGNLHSPVHCSACLSHLSGGKMALHFTYCVLFTSLDCKILDITNFLAAVAFLCLSQLPFQDLHHSDIFGISS